MARRTLRLNLAAVCAALLWVSLSSAAAAQQRCPAWELTGRWAVTFTTAGETMSMRAGAAELVHRGADVLGRWEPGGEDDRHRAVEGRFADGLLRLTIHWEQATWQALLALSSDGQLLTGGWQASTGKHGELFLKGEATCVTVPTAISADTARPAARCAAWDLSGEWLVSWDDATPAAEGAAAEAPSADSLWRLRLLQSGDQLTGWYFAVGAAGESRRWTVAGTLAGRALSLTTHFDDGASVRRTLALNPSGRTLRGPWPIQFGLLDEETLSGAARCAVRSDE